MRSTPVFVGLDGRSGSGKTTIAAALLRCLGDVEGGVTIVEGDLFYGGGSAALWDRRSAIENLEGVIDWRKQRSVMQRLRDDGEAEWFPFDWDSDDWDADEAPLASAPVRSRAGAVVVLEGAYSCRPELHDLLDLRALLQVPSDLRRHQLLDREAEQHQADWDARWSAAEALYFESIMPAVRFDVVIGIG